jgi:hypothetical protein
MAEAASMTEVNEDPNSAPKDGSGLTFSSVTA